MLYRMPHCAILLGILPAMLWTVSAWAESAPHRIGRFPQEIAHHYTADNGLPSDDVTCVWIDGGGRVLALAGGQVVVFDGAAWVALDAPTVPPAPQPRAATYPGKPTAYATREGLLLEAATGARTPLDIHDGLGRRWAASDVRGVAYDPEGRLWFATLAGAGHQTTEGWKFFTGQEGLPYNDFTCVVAVPDGEMWFGTTKGAIRYDGKEWAYRQGLRWLPDDHVRDIAVDGDGNVWFATPRGIGRIERRMMTLAEKAAHYEDEMDLIRRTPFGYVSEVHLKAPGDRSEIIRSDSDNDGLWTSMYGAGECFAYAATGDPKAKDRAKRAFEALRFLQKVTQGAEHSPPHGYVARTILPTDGPDPNVGRIERDLEHREKNDSLWKIYEPRWPKSADGQWYFKTDTSSDELDGHYFFYPLYYDLVADTEEEKDRVREVVRDLTNHLVEHGFYLVDHDGTPTRWAVYGPASLNNDPMWFPERGLNSLSILSYLAVASHVTGDPKYDAAARELIDKHGYAHNLMFPKLQFGVGSGNQSDDEMAVMSYYSLLKCTKDEKLRDQALASFYMYWILEQPEMNPLFNFAYAAHGIGAKVTDPYGTYGIAPWRGWIEDTVATLKGFSLDRCNWGHLNSHRIDIVRLPRQQASEPTVPMRRDRGHRVNGKVLPVENRHFGHWNTDPWQLDYGGDGRELANGTVFLLPYYMGLYHGFIEEIPEAPE